MIREGAAVGAVDAHEHAQYVRLSSFIFQRKGIDGRNGLSNRGTRNV